MATSVEDLERRMAAMEQEMKRLARLVEDPEAVDRPPTDGTFNEWLARLQEKKMARISDAELRQALGIPADLKPIGAKAVREMMLAEGIRPEERILSSEIIRLREETRPPEEKQP